MELAGPEPATSVVTAALSLTGVTPVLCPCVEVVGSAPALAGELQRLRSVGAKLTGRRVHPVCRVLEPDKKLERQTAGRLTERAGRVDDRAQLEHLLWSSVSWYVPTVARAARRSALDGSRHGRRGSLDRYPESLALMSRRQLARIALASVEAARARWPAEPCSHAACGSAVHASRIGN